MPLLATLANAPNSAPPATLLNFLRAFVDAVTALLFVFIASLFLVLTTMLSPVALLSAVSFLLTSLGSMPAFLAMASVTDIRRCSVTSLATPLPPTLPISTSSATICFLSYVRI